MARGTLTKKQKELVDHLVKAGMQKNVAKTLVFVASKEETTSRDIEFATDLRQPEVSISMQVLRENGWIAKRDIKKEGKGRPVHGYRLDKTIADIVKEIEAEEKKRIDEIKNNITKIKQLIKSIY